MILTTKNRFRPIYKQLFKLRENVQNRIKILRFKKQKWQKLIAIYKRKLKIYKRIKPKDQIQYIVSRHSSVSFSYKKQYKNNLISIKKIKLIYGGLLHKTVTILLNNKLKILNRLEFLKIFETRLDIVLFRSKFGSNIRFVRQLISHGKILVNNKFITIKSFILKPGDIIVVKPKYYKFLQNNVSRSTWPIYPKYLTVNYKTMQIIFNSIHKTNFSLNLFYHSDLEKILIAKFMPR